MKKRRKKRKEVSSIGRIVDLPMEEFKSEIVRQRVNIGTINNLILIMSGAYHELSARKEAVMDLVFSGKKTKEEVKAVLEGLYSEMVKLEQKIIYLKEVSKSLLNVD